MTEISLRANRLANEFEGLCSEHALQHGDAPVARITATAPIGTVVHELTTEKLTEAAELLRERGEGLTVSVHDRVALEQAMYGMPYGSAVSFRPRVQSVADVVSYLHSLADVLTSVAARAEQQRAELLQLRMQREAVRSFFGVRELQEDVSMLFENAELDRAEGDEDGS